MKKIDVKHLWNTKKKWIIGITAGVTAAAVGCSAWYYAGHTSKDPVYVYPFQYIGMTEYWGDSQESYGPVSTDKIQTVFLSDTQTVTEVLVQAGDAVKKGDLLMTFDTTLSDLQMERKRLDVEKLKLQYADARDELMYINCLKPMEVPTVSDDPEDSGSGVSLKSIELFPRETDVVNRTVYDGSTAEKALIYWIFDSTDISSDLFAAADAYAAVLQAANKPEETVPEEDENGGREDSGDEGMQWPIGPFPGWGPEDEEGNDSSEGSTQEDGNEPEQTTAPNGELQTSDEGMEQIPSNASAAETEELPDGSSFYLVIKTTSGNTTLGQKKVWQCLKVTKSGGGYAFRFADTVIPDYSVNQLGADDDSDDTPEVDYGSGYTAAEIAQMRSDKQKEIKDLDFKIKMADAEYRIMLKEVSDGNVYAENDGKVVSVLTEEEAKQTRQPILKVSGGGGFFVEGFVSELEKDNMKPGQEVTVNDWNTGMTYTGTVKSIGDFPTQDGYYNGSGNPNASYYPFQVFVDESADLQAGAYVSVMYASAESENGIYLENPFLRTEKGESYVLVLGKDGKLEQRQVTTGKSLWGSYTQILSGLTAEDLIAFPYGKNVKPGVAAQEGDLSKLYG